MENYGAFCPNEECANNNGGTCGLRQAALLGMGAWAFQPLGTGAFLSPVAPIAGLLSDDRSAEGHEGSADRGLFAECPHRRGLRD
jgi:hypothetical protein